VIVDLRPSVQKIGRNAKHRERQVQSKFGSSKGDYVISYRKPRPSPNVPRQTSTLRTTGANISAARQALRDSGFKVTGVKQQGFWGRLFG
jgi:hypothetical protein